MRLRGLLCLWLLTWGVLPAQLPDTVPLRLVERHWLLPVSVNGAAPVWFVFDTGAGGIFLDQEYAQQQGILPEGRVTMHGSVGSSHATYAAGQRLQLGRTTLDSVTFYLGPIRHISQALNIPVAGIIGYDVLSQYLVEVDPAANRMLLHDFAQPPRLPETAWLPIRQLANNLIVTDAVLHLGGQALRLPLIVDSGSNRHVTIDKWAVDSLRLAETVSVRVGSRGRGITAHQTRMLLATADSMDLPPLRFSSLPVALGAGTPEAALNRQSAGTIGQGLLLQFRVFYDYRRQRMAWLPLN